MGVAAASEDELAVLGALIRAWAEDESASNELVADVEEHPEDRRWLVRLRGDEKTMVTVWLTLRERTLHFETYFMPAPEEQVEACWGYLLRANMKLFACRFAVGPEDAVYLVGQLPWGAVDLEELDRIIGSLYAYSEQYFPSAMSIGFASRYRRFS